MLMKLRKMAQAVLVALVALLLLTSPVLAIANPTSIALNTVKVFQNIFVAGDVLFIGEHNINYVPPSNPEPSEKAKDVFFLQLRSVDNATLIRARGATEYQWNLTSIYLSPAQVTAASIVFANQVAYRVRITGNPASFATLTEGTNMATKALSPTDWNADGVLTSRHLLVDYCIDIAGRMEDDLNKILLATTVTGVTVLNNTGRVLFLAAIPNLDTAVPELFQVSSSVATLTEKTVTATYETETTITNKLGSQVASAFAGIGTWLGINAQMSAGLWIMLFMLTIASIVFLNSGNITGATILAIPIGVMGAYVGAIPMYILFTVAILAVAYMFYFFWLRGT